MDGAALCGEQPEGGHCASAVGRWQRRGFLERLWQHALVAHRRGQQTQPEVVKMLLEAGADPRKQNSEGVSPLDIVKARKVNELVQMMQKFRSY